MDAHPDADLIAKVQHYLAEEAALHRYCALCNGDFDRLPLPERRDYHRRNKLNQALEAEIADRAPATLEGAAWKAKMLMGPLTFWADGSPTDEDYGLWRFCQQVMQLGGLHPAA